VALSLIWACLGLALQTSQYTLSFERNRFVIKADATEEHVSLNPSEATRPSFIAFRKDEAFAVWDARGLTIRKHGEAASYRLSGFPLDPRFFSEEEIDQTRRAVENGTKTLEANGISGARRIGSRVYFLVKWTDADNKPWLEALVQVDFDSQPLEPKILGRFTGLTDSRALIDNRLFIGTGGLSAVTLRTSDWGISSYSMANHSFEYVSLGEQLLRWSPPNLYLEQTSYGTRIGGRLSLAGLKTHPLFEDRGNINWLGAESNGVSAVGTDSPPIALQLNDSQQILRNCDTGEELSLGPRAIIKRVSGGILAWTPAVHPTYAVLLEPSNWKKLAVWRRPK
jgi:hypothetical protein